MAATTGAVGVDAGSLAVLRVLDDLSRQQEQLAIGLHQCMEAIGAQGHGFCTAASTSTPGQYLSSMFQQLLQDEAKRQRQQRAPDEPD